SLVPANTADQVVAAGGLGEFSAVSLEKKLAGKAVQIQPSIDELEEGLSGNASPKDAQTLFELIYLTFTAPRPDPVVFDVIKTQFKTFLENRTQSPESVFSDTLRTTMQRDQPRFRPMTVDEIPEMSLEKSLAFYRDRFADASDFTFFFVGNLDLEKIEPLVCTYLASLPSIHRTETWKDWRVPPPEGVVKKTVEKGVEPKSLTAIVFSGPFENNAGNRAHIRAAAQVLETRLGTDPARIDEMSAAIFREIKALRKKGPTAKEVEEIRLAESRDFETSSRQNGWWLSQISERYRVGEDPAGIVRLPESFGPAGIVRLPESFGLLTQKSVQAAARTYFDLKRYVQVTLYPEKR
ncbi:MAG: ptrA 2, partial [Candidatus Aminicenantes bacterium]|nr:ptrA 2 [Candidatus Aminicenantes bacterium]